MVDGKTALPSTGGVVASVLQNVSLELFANALLPMAVTVAGISTVPMMLQPSNALIPMESRLGGKISLVMGEYWNVEALMFSNPVQADKSTVFNA